MSHGEVSRVRPGGPEGSPPREAAQQAAAADRMGLAAPRRYRGSWWRLYRSELRLILSRARNIVLLIGFAAVPLAIGLAVFFFGDDPSPHGATFVDRLTGNGMFLVFAALLVSVPVFLPVGVGVLTGDAIAGEANVGTLRYLLTVPVSRTRLLGIKAAAVLTCTALAVVAITLVGIVAGGLLFGFGPVTLLSGDQVSLGEGLVRVAGVAGYVIASMTGLIAVGLLCSTLTEVPIAAMAATVVVAVVSTVLTQLPQLKAIHAGLLTYHWLDFTAFLSIQVDPGPMLRGLLVQVAWAAVAGSLAWARLTSRDITC